MDHPFAIKGATSSFRSFGASQPEPSTDSQVRLVDLDLSETSPKAAALFGLRFRVRALEFILDFSEGSRQMSDALDSRRLFCWLFRKLVYEQSTHQRSMLGSRLLEASGYFIQYNGAIA